VVRGTTVKTLNRGSIEFDDLVIDLNGVYEFEAQVVYQNPRRRFVAVSNTFQVTPR